MAPLSDDLEQIARLQPGLKKNGRWLDLRLLISIVGWVVTLMLAYGAVNTRLSVVESKTAEYERRLMRIEDKLDSLLRRP